MNNFMRASTRCFFIFLLSLLGASAIAADSPPQCIWYAGDKALNQVRTDSNLISQTVSLKDVKMLAMNASDCGVLALSKKTIYRYDANAALVQTIDLRMLNKDMDEEDDDDDDAGQDAATSYDDGAWLRKNEASG